MSRVPTSTLPSMRLPDAEGFIAAAQKALEDGKMDVVYLHDAAGEICGVLVRPEVWRDPWRFKNRRPMELHSRIESGQGDEVPWLAEDEPPPPTPISPDYWETAE